MKLKIFISVVHMFSLIGCTFGLSVKTRSADDSNMIDYKNASESIVDKQSTLHTSSSINEPYISERMIDDQSSLHTSSSINEPSSFIRSVESNESLLSSSVIIQNSSSDLPIDFNDGIKITTFNIGHFTNGAYVSPNGTYSDFNEYKMIFDSIHPDIMTINENSPFFDADNTINVTRLYSLFPNYVCGKSLSYDCNAIASKYNIIDSTEKLFANSNNRYYIDSTINIDGILVHVIVSHLELSDIKERNEQISELLDLVFQYDYFILCGDMNPASKIDDVSSDNPLSQYSFDYNRFKEHGYKLANCGEYGVFNTLVKQEGIDCYPWDNIIVSSTIDIIRVKREDIVLSDHYPLSAVIKIISSE